MMGIMCVVLLVYVVLLGVAGRGQFGDLKVLLIGGVHVLVLCMRRYLSMK